MPQNLSINLNNSGLSKPQISAHAQNFSTSQLRQKKEIFGAKTSMDKVIKKSSNNSPLSSISRTGQGNSSISTSASHTGMRSSENEDDARRDEIRDRLRFKHIRQMRNTNLNTPPKAGQSRSDNKHKSDHQS